MGDSMLLKLNGFTMTKDVGYKYLIKVRPYKSAKVSCMVDHTKPTIRDLNPEWICLHVGTNDLCLEKTSSQIAKSIIDLAKSIQSDTNKIIISLIVPRLDELRYKAIEVNNRLIHMCKKRNIYFIDHTENINPEKHLNQGKIHLSKYGSNFFAKSFTDFFMNLD